MSVLTPPRVSIGLPVYNGENFLALTLDSLLTQTYQDFEIIICDNASTDATQQICRAYAESDPRVRYYRNTCNIGAAPNFNRTFKLSRGEYFKWSAHDDLCAPTFLEKCVAALDADASAVLCCSEILYIDAAGEVIGESPYNRALATGSPRPEERFCSLMLSGCMNFTIFGLIRAEALRRTPLQGSYDAADQILLARLALLGRFHEIPEGLFFYRLHAGQSINLGHDPVAYSVWFDPANKGRILFPHWRYFAEYWKAVQEADLSLRARTYCYVELARWFRWSTRRLAQDLKGAARLIQRRYFSGKHPAHA